MSRLPYMVAIAGLVTGCAKEPTVSSGVVARVGDAVLYQDDLAAWEASMREGPVSEEARAAFVRRWVEDELLYQEALSRDLLSDPWVTDRVAELTRRMAVARLLELEAQGVRQPSQDALQAYFQAHSPEFTWPHLHLVAEYWSSPNQLALSQLRSNLISGRPPGIWAGSSGELESGTLTLDGPGSAAPEVWRVLEGMGAGEVSQPIRLSDRYWVFKLKERRKPGSMQTLEDVRDDIAARLIYEEMEKRRAELIARLADEYRRSGRLVWTTAAEIPPAKTDPAIRTSSSTSQ